MVRAAETANAANSDSAAAATEPAETAESVRGRRLRMQLDAIVADLLGTGQKKGFFGTAAITVLFHDGNIQHITRSMEQTMR